MLRQDIEAYVKGCDICLALKVIYYKLYKDLQLLPVPIHRWKDLSIDFLTGLLVSANWKGNSYDLILVIIDWLTKMVYYVPVKVMIDALSLAEVIINMVVRHHGVLGSIVTDQDLFFTSKF